MLNKQRCINTLVLRISYRGIYNPFDNSLEKIKKYNEKQEKAREQMEQADQVMKHDRTSNRQLIGENFIYGKQMNKYPKLIKRNETKIQQEIAK